MGWLKDFFSQFRLAWELLWDGRVPFVTKLVPLMTALYLLSPVDIIPDGLLGLGQLDDLTIFLIGLRLFIDVCPPALVAKHQQEETPPEISVTPPPAEQTASTAWTPPAGPIIDLEAKVVSDAAPLSNTEIPSNTGALPESEVKPKHPVPPVW